MLQRKAGIGSLAMRRLIWPLRRLQKLEEYVMAVLDDPEAQARLSARELQYAKVGSNSP